jgi:type IV secretory pathway VirB2 component (pilin)
LSIASAIVLPISGSALAEMAPTWAISLEVVHGLLIFFSSSTAVRTALSMPR